MQKNTIYEKYKDAIEFTISSLEAKVAQYKAILKKLLKEQGKQEQENIRVDVRLYRQIIQCRFHINEAENDIKFYKIMSKKIDPELGLCMAFKSEKEYELAFLALSPKEKFLEEEEKFQVLMQISEFNINELSKTENMLAQLTDRIEIDRNLEELEEKVNEIEPKETIEIETPVAEETSIKLDEREMEIYSVAQKINKELESMEIAPEKEYAEIYCDLFDGLDVNKIIESYEADQELNLSHIYISLNKILFPLIETEKKDDVIKCLEQVIELYDKYQKHLEEIARMRLEIQKQADFALEILDEYEDVLDEYEKNEHIYDSIFDQVLESDEIDIQDLLRGDSRSKNYFSSMKNLLSILTNLKTLIGEFEQMKDTEIEESKETVLELFKENFDNLNSFEENPLNEEFKEELERMQYEQEQAYLEMEELEEPAVEETETITQQLPVKFYMSGEKNYIESDMKELLAYLNDNPEYILKLYENLKSGNFVARTLNNNKKLAGLKEVKGDTHGIRLLFRTINGEYVVVGLVQKKSDNDRVHQNFLKSRYKKFKTDVRKNNILSRDDQSEYIKSFEESIGYVGGQARL